MLTLKLLKYISKKGAEHVDVGSPLFLDGVQMILDIAKEVIKPF